MATRVSSQVKGGPVENAVCRTRVRVVTKYTGDDSCKLHHKTVEKYPVLKSNSVPGVERIGGMRFAEMESYCLL